MESVYEMQGTEGTVLIRIKKNGCGGGKTFRCLLWREACHECGFMRERIASSEILYKNKLDPWYC